MRYTVDQIRSHNHGITNPARLNVSAMPTDVMDARPNPENWGGKEHCSENKVSDNGDESASFKEEQTKKREEGSDSKNCSRAVLR
jgi:hypothetical protein